MINWILLSAEASHQITAWENFVSIINMPVAGALGLVVLVTWLAMRQAFHNDRLIEEGRKDEILADMQKH